MVSSKTAAQLSARARLVKAATELKARAARASLLEFTCQTKSDYRVNWHHDLYASVLDDFISGKVKRLMVFMPPQHGKSELCTRRLPAKLLGDHPHKRLAVVAYNHTFASKFNRDIQRIIDSPQYRAIYPNTQLYGRNTRTASDRAWLRNSDEFEVVEHGGSLISVGVGGGLTGNKVDVAIIDDPYKDPAQANSEAYRATLEDWWDSVLETRLNNDGQICLTFTRWRHDDIAGRLLDLQKQGLTIDDWEVVIFQGIKEEGVGHPDDPREVGQALWPEEHSEEKLRNIEKKNPSAFSALIQQRPSLKKGNVIKEDHFFRYELQELPDSVPRHCYIDTAQSEEELKKNDPSGILVWALYKGRVYLTYYEWGRWGITDLTTKITQVHDRFMSGRLSKNWIENKSNARSVKDILKKETQLNVILENIKGGKMERVENELPTLEGKKVGLPLGESWVPHFLAEVKGFPLAPHDESVDCLTGTIRTALGSAVNMPIFAKKRT